MSNGQLHDDKLFQGLHDRLSDYEAPYDGADWDAMSRSLDKLPKSNNFRWKFSLNTIGIALGIAGLTVVGVVLASGPENTPRPAESNTVIAPAPPSNTNNSNTNVPVTNPQPAPTVIATNSAMTLTGGTQEVNTYRNLSNPKRTEEKFNNPFRLGDQLDPVKGLVKETSEDPALLKGHDDLKQPEVYYDIDENGNVKPIRIKHDKDSSMQELKQDSVPPPPVDGPEPDAPMDGQRNGFGDEEPN